MKVATSLALCLLLGSCASLVEPPHVEQVEIAPPKPVRAKIKPPPEVHIIVEQKKQAAPAPRPIGESSVECKLEEVIKCNTEE